MRLFSGAPNFTAWPDPVDGRWKIRFLEWLQEVTKIEMLLETGTCHGVTPQCLSEKFKNIYTIELHDELFQISKERLSQLPNVHLYHGSSRTMLDTILTNDVPAGRILFWLDAHNSGPHTANDGDPLPDELEAATRLRPDALIVVDDQMDIMHFYDQIFQGRPELFETFKDYNIEFRTGEIMLHRKGVYNIPEFVK